MADRSLAEGPPAPAAGLTPAFYLAAGLLLTPARRYFRALGYAYVVSLVLMPKRPLAELWPEVKCFSC